MSATNMKPIKDNTLSGIVASALVHEVFSYVPPKTSIDQLMEEICRTLEKEGIFIYRDPQWVDEPSTQCLLILQKDIAKYYTVLFLTKFLDRTFSLHRDYKDECCKPCLYSYEDILVNAYLKKSDTCQQFPLKKFLKTPSSIIDYTKSFSLEAPKGLIAEIQRHYLMFLKNYYIAGLLDQKYFESDLQLSTFSTEEQDILKTYLKRKSIPILQNCVKKEHFPLLFSEEKKIRTLFDKGLAVTWASNKKLDEFISQTPHESLDRNQLYRNDATTIIIDPIALTLLFHGKHNDLFTSIDMAEVIPHDLLEHLKLEGEEHYFYKTLDELITYVGQYSRFILKDTHKKKFILAPIDVEHIKVAPRTLYQGILERDMLVLDKHGVVQKMPAGKNIIHFQLQLEEKAFQVYKNLVKIKPESFPALQRWISLVLSPRSS